MGQDQLILMLCVTVFLSYLPEAGEYSCFFVYLKLVSNIHTHFTMKIASKWQNALTILFTLSIFCYLEGLMYTVADQHDKS